ncbi:uncharacterized protein IAS62_004900 [Cryptococcus decagattii]|uniref:Uncharacterized protein n=1 Tax=Cryptococcus decagattii TaxID=1859122 RepID=A0ABZ2AYC6_9TREE
MEQRIVIRSRTDEEWWKMGVRFQGQDFVLSQVPSLPCRFTTTTQNSNPQFLKHTYIQAASPSSLYTPLLPPPPFSLLFLPASGGFETSRRLSIAPQQVNARILRIHRIERYPIKSRPYLDVNIFVVL